MTPRAEVHVLGHGHIVKMQHSENAIFLLFLSTLGHGSDKKVRYKVIMTKEWSTIIVNFMSPLVRAWPYKSL